MSGLQCTLPSIALVQLQVHVLQWFTFVFLQESGSQACSSLVLDPGLKCKLACLCPCAQEQLLILGLKGHCCRPVCQAAIYRTCHEQYHQKSEPLHEGALMAAPHCTTQFIVTLTAALASASRPSPKRCLRYHVRASTRRFGSGPHVMSYTVQWRLSAGQNDGGWRPCACHARVFRRRGTLCQRMAVEVDRLTAALSGFESILPRNKAPLQRSATDGGDVRGGLASAAALRTTAGGQPLHSLPLFPTSARRRLKHACGKHFWEWKTKRRNSTVGRQPRRLPTHLPGSGTQRPFLHPAPAFS